MWDSLWTKLRKPLINAFATCLNNQPPRYWSPVPDPLAEAIDAMAQPWDKESLYMFPPFPLLPAVLRKLKSQPHEYVVLILPWNEGAPWFPDLQELSLHKDFLRVPLPLWPDLLLQPLSGVAKQDSHNLHLNACALSRTPSEQKATHNQPYSSCSTLSLKAPIETLDGKSSSIGARLKALELLLQ